MPHACPFFHAWSPEMAYALGYWFGDGNMYRTGSEVFKLVICRKELFEDLRRLGGVERKSLVLAWPAGVPRDLLPHLARGYVDGDGCLSWHRTGSSVHPLLDIVGTREFVLGLGAAIEEATGVPLPTCHQQSKTSNTWRIKWYGVAAKCVALWLNQMNAGPALERKAKLSQEFARWEPQVFRPSRVTAKM